MPKYRLVRNFFDKQLFEKGSILEFEEGKQPKGSIPVDGAEEEAGAEEASAPELEIQPDLLGLDNDMTTLSQIAAGKKK